MRLASYNVENLFDRARAMNLKKPAEGKPILERFAEMSALLAQPSYSAADKSRMAKLLRALGLERSDTGEFVILRRNRGALLRRPRSGGVEIVADGRADWVGSLELIDEPIDEQAMRNTARVMRDIEADVLGVVEVESRPVLRDFNNDVISALGGEAFRHAMVIDGNDTRGIDVGLLTRRDFPIGLLRSHVDDMLGERDLIFSRDCAEYEVTTPSGARILLLLNHFKSKGYGSQQSSNDRRRNQAQRVAEIYDERVGMGIKNIAVLGDFNDTPDSEPLRPLIEGTDLKDIFLHPTFDNGGYPGTYGNCSAENKIDFILLSPALFDKVTGGGVFRKGLWPGARARRWEAYPELQRKEDAASDHAAIWADIDI
ncbi:MAG: endonuclease/exonuclease/phosphatase family protein [Methylocystis sp.]